MNVFLIIVFSIPISAIVWWWWAHRQARVLPRSIWWRIGIAAFVLAHMAFLGLLFAGRADVVQWEMPRWMRLTTYTWHLLGIPLAMVVMFTSIVVFGAIAITRRMTRKEGVEPPPDGMSRRELLLRGASAGVGIAAAPVASMVGVAKGLNELGTFRTREIDVPLANLPRDLEGLRIAHVTDIHVGRWTSKAMLDQIAERTNQLRSDLVLVTGDVIDNATADLPAATAALRRIDGPLYVCEGNHDLFGGRQAFADSMYNAGLRLLVNEGETLKLRGVDVRLLGLRWGSLSGGRGADIELNMLELERVRRPEEFEVLLAHHPHAFDSARAADIPLTFAGHTHGGQLNLSEHIGVGPAMYRYWSGLYNSRSERGDSACIVSNGVGNWFPLRVNTPAEIVLVTLRRA